MFTVNSLINKARSQYLAIGQKVGAMKVAPSNEGIQGTLFVVGVVLLTTGLANGAFARGSGFGVSLDSHDITYNDDHIAQAVIAVLTMIEGSFGALVMVGSGIAAILSSAFGQYRAALGCLVVAVGSFILRNIMSTFFNTKSIDQDSQN